LLPRTLRRHIQRFSEAGPLSDALAERLSRGKPSRKKWYRSQKEHWIGWLEEYHGPGAYNRKGRNRTADFAYNHIMCAPMLLWLAEASGVSKALLRKASRHALAARSEARACAEIRAAIPWERIEEKLR
jgi:hypothetical protein